MLCFRCEKRARFLENKPDGFRMECKNIENSVISCYQFIPCKPVVTKKSDKKDKRPRFMSLIGAREEGVRLLDEAILSPVIVNKKTGEVALVYKEKEKSNEKNN